MIAIVLFIFLAIWILLTKFAMKIGGYLFRCFPPDNPRAERWGAFLGIYAGDGLGVGLLDGGSGRRPYLCGTNVQAGGDYGLCNAGAVEESHEGKCG